MRYFIKQKNMERKSSKQKAIIFSVVFLLFVGISLGISYLNWQNNYRNRINPGIKIGQIDLGGLTKDQAENKIDIEANRLETSGLTVSYADKQVTLPSVIALNTDLSFPVFTYDREKTMQKVLAASSQNSFFSYLSSFIKKVFFDQNIEMAYSLDKDRAKSFLSENLKDLEIKPLDASFTIKKNTGNDLSFAIEPERVGKQIDYDLAFDHIEEHLKNLDNKTIYLKTITSRPSVYTDDLEPLTTAAENLISRDSLKLTASSTATGTPTSAWTVDKNTLASWVISDGENGDYHISLDTAKIADYLKEKIAPDIDQEAKLPKYEIKNGKMTSWQSSTDGRKLNLEASANKIKEEYLTNNNSRIELIIDTIKNDTAENIDNLHIEEIIGTGSSNFSGSSAARRRNIEVGAKAVSGTLIAPGEEFSLIKILGEIDASSGYVPELVIKNNQTIPEYGGGLCQVGTTIFRSALKSGLPITARQNHSYRVSYYEPAGTDAAVYDPWPDVRFLNDTGNYILIQSRIEKNNIYFDFWGKKDGRIAFSTTPVIYNITKPAPAKIIETTTLKPGEKKCTERAHNGADAYFDYKVTYPTGNILTKRFKSHYVPWQEVCLIGIAATSTSETASSTTKQK